MQTNHESIISEIPETFLAAQIAILACHLSKTKEPHDIYEKMGEATKMILHAKNHIDLRFSKT